MAAAGWSGCGASGAAGWWRSIVALSSRRSTGQQVERCCRDGDWVVLEGESGSGRAKLGQAVDTARGSRACRAGVAYPRLRSPPGISSPSLNPLRDDEDFAVVIANVVKLTTNTLKRLAAVLQYLRRAGLGGGNRRRRDAVTVG